MFCQPTCENASPYKVVLAEIAYELEKATFIILDSIESDQEEMHHTDAETPLSKDTKPPRKRS